MARPLLALLIAAALLACRQDMHDQPRHEPLEPSEMFTDGRSARPRVEGTVARGELNSDVLLHTGLLDGKPSEVFPFPIDRSVLERGRGRYDIFCSVCHDRAGTGGGMVVKRGFTKPPTLHDDRLREAPVGQLFDVVTNGFGNMPPYKAQISVRDRWAIIAYLRALQRSQDGRLIDVPEAERARLEAEK